MAVKIPDYLSERPVSPKSPTAIMLEAAENLTQQTHNLIAGNVFTINSGGSNLFRYTFYLVAPYLNDFSDPLFYAWHGVEPYPIWLMPSSGKQGRDDKKYATPDEFEQALADIFDSDSARQRIYVILDAVQQGQPIVQP